jgi:beta-lactamase superfamily II metal-dependent hydrolase
LSSCTTFQETSPPPENKSVLNVGSNKLGNSQAKLNVKKSAFASGAGTTDFIAFDVGQGNCNLLMCSNGDNVMIDCGSSSNYLKTTDAIAKITTILNKYTVDAATGKYRFKTVVISHSHKDHFNFFPQLFTSANSEIDNILIGGARTEYKNDIGKWLKDMETNGSTIKAFPAGTIVNQVAPTINYGCTKAGAPTEGLYIIGAGYGTATGDENDRSIVIRAEVGDQSITFMGDASKSVETQINNFYRTRAIKGIATTFLVSSHHGSNTANDPVWIRDTDPTAVIFSAGDNKMYGLPRCSVYDTFEALPGRHILPASHPFSCYDKQKVKRMWGPKPGTSPTSINLPVFNTLDVGTFWNVSAGSGGSSGWLCADSIEAHCVPIY